MSASTTLKARSSWLGRPWFFVAVVALALNDHVFKGAWPGWLTGKLSDFAGLVVVATLAAVLFGPRWGTVVAGVGFVALKTVPGVAELASPVLGGVTLRDPSDLIALAVLPPVWALLHAVPNPARTRRVWAVAGLVAGVLATTATSSVQTPDVMLESGSGVIYANVDPGDGFNREVLATTDGGQTWAKVPEGSGPDAREWTSQRYDRDLHVCAPDATCYRGTNGTSGEWAGVLIDRLPPGSNWQLDGRVPRLGYEPAFALDTAAPDRAVLSGENRTVYYRRSAGDWVAVDLGALVGPPTWVRSAVTTLGQFGVVTILTFLVGAGMIWLLVPWTPVKVVLEVLVNVLACGILAVITALGAPPSRLQVHAAWLGILLVLTAMMRVTWWQERRSALPAQPVEDLR